MVKDPSMTSCGFMSGRRSAELIGNLIALTLRRNAFFFLLLFLRGHRKFNDGPSAPKAFLPNCAPVEAKHTFCTSKIQTHFCRRRKMHPLQHEMQSVDGCMKPGPGRQRNGSPSAAAIPKSLGRCRWRAEKSNAIVKYGVPSRRNGLFLKKA